MKNKLKKIGAVVAGVALTAAPMFAAGEPLDLTATGATLAGYVAVAATAGVVVFAALMGVRVLKKGFKIAAS